MRRLLCLFLVLNACSLTGLPSSGDDAGPVPNPGLVIHPPGGASDAGARDWGPALPDAGPGVCGDGIHNGNYVPVHPDYEECDDGNLDETDGCTTACRRPILGMAIGNYHNCVLGADRIVRCVGQNTAGQLGRSGDPTPWEYAFAPVRGLGPVRKLVGTRGTFACALEESGGVKCWGSGWSGQLGLGERGSRTTPTTPEGMDGEMLDIWASGNTTLVRKVDGSTWCAGQNTSGRCGNGTASNQVLTFVPTPQLDGLAQIVMGSAHHCGIDDEERLWCWGQNGAGELGTGDKQERRAPTRVESLDRVTQVAVGDDHTCAMHGDQSISCWGANWGGQLGNGDWRPSLEPVALEGLVGATQIVALGHNTCVAGPELGLRCWGFNDYGQVGEVTGRIVSSPHDPGIDDGQHQPVKLFPGQLSTCSLGLDGRVFCWGMNPFGKLGRAQAGGIVSRPTAMETSKRFVRISGGHRHACGVGTDGKAYCWGINPYGQIGDGTVSVAFTPKRAGTLTQVEAVEAGFRHTCAVRENGELYCWGDNRQRALGLGINDEKVSTPSLVASLPGVAQVGVGLDTTCAVTVAQELYCWGNDARGQLGMGEGHQNKQTPTQVQLFGVTQISIWARTACAIVGAGQLYCWGLNDAGQVGRGAGAESRIWEPVPVLFNEGTQPAVRRVATGIQHTCAELVDQSLHCWGRNSEGQLADLTTSQRNNPVPVGAFTNLVDIELGYYHTCLINGLEAGQEVGVARCAGWGAFGQVGDGRNRNQPASVAVGDLGPVKDLALSQHSTCALAEDGQVFCWGYTGQGNLGGGSDVTEWTPGLMLPIH